jgi:hypothetical protein
MAEAQSESEQRAEEIRKAANWYMVDQARLRREAQEQRERQSRREVTPSGRAMGWIFLLGFLALLVGGYAYEIHKAVRRKPAG